MIQLIKRSIAKVTFRSSNIGSTWITDGMRRSLRTIPENFSLSTAEEFPAVSRAVDFIGWCISTLPIKVYNVSRNGTETLAEPDEEIDIITKKWSNFESSTDGLYRFISSIMLNGHGAVYVQKDQNTNQLQSLHCLDPTLVQKQRISDEIVYKYNGPSSKIIPKILPRDDIFYLPFKPPRDGLSIESPLSLHWKSIRQALAALNFIAWYYDNGASANGLLTIGDKLSVGKFKEIQDEFWNRQDEMRRQGRRWSILPGPWKYQNAGSNAAEAKVHEQLNHAIQDVARIYGMSSLLLEELTRSTYSNYEQARHSTGETITVWSKRLSTEFSNILWPMGTRRLVIDASNCIRAEFKRRMEGYEIAVRTGVFTRNECRELEGREKSDQEGMDSYDVNVISAPSITVNNSE